MGAPDASPLLEKGDHSLMRRMRDVYSASTNMYYSTLLMIALFVTGTINSVVSKRMFDAYTDKYAYFANQGNNFNYIILSGAVLGYKLVFTQDITPEMRAFPHRRYWVMATADGLAGFLSSLGAAYTPGQYQTLINQTQIPFTMVAAFILLGTRYSKSEISAATTVIIGTCIAILPSFIHSEHQVGQMKLSAVTLYILSNLPMAYSAVYKELGFKDLILECYLLTFWVSVYQFLVSFLFAPIQGLPGFGGVPLGDIPGQFMDGLSCFAGVSKSPDVDCTYTGLWLCVYSCINFVYNVLGLWLTKEGSSAGLGAVLCTIAYAIKVPLSNIAFTIPWVMGSETEKLTTFSLLGLVVVLIGFCWYMQTTILKGNDDDEKEKEGENELAHAVETWGFHDRGDFIVPVAAHSRPPSSHAGHMYQTI